LKEEEIKREQKKKKKRKEIHVDLRSLPLFT